MIINNKKVEHHFLFKYKKYDIGEPLFVPLCDRELKILDVKNIELTENYKLVKCVGCRIQAPRVLGIKIYPRGPNRVTNRWKREKQRQNRNSKLKGIPNWKRFKSHKNEDEVKLHAVK